MSCLIKQRCSSLFTVQSVHSLVCSVAYFWNYFTLAHLFLLILVPEYCVYHLTDLAEGGTLRGLQIPAHLHDHVAARTAQDISQTEQNLNCRFFNVSKLCSVKSDCMAGLDTYEVHSEGEQFEQRDPFISAPGPPG